MKKILILKKALTHSWLDDQWRHFDDENVTKVYNPDQFIKEKFTERTPYLIFYVRITRQTLPIENNATQVTVTTINETTMDNTESSDTENDFLNEAMIDDETETMKG